MILKFQYNFILFYCLKKEMFSLMVIATTMIGAASNSFIVSANSQSANIDYCLEVLGKPSGLLTPCFRTSQEYETAAVSFSYSNYQTVSHPRALPHFPG
jgi:hypothetical protein